LIENKARSRNWDVDWTPYHPIKQCFVSHPFPFLRPDYKKKKFSGQFFAFFIFDIFLEIHSHQNLKYPFTLSRGASEQQKFDTDHTTNLPVLNLWVLELFLDTLALAHNWGLRKPFRWKWGNEKAFWTSFFSRHIFRSQKSCLVSQI
jgi:hypothetical protein